MPPPILNRDLGWPILNRDLGWRGCLDATSGKVARQSGQVVPPWASTPSKHSLCNVFPHQPLMINGLPPRGLHSSRQIEQVDADDIDNNLICMYVSFYSLGWINDPSLSVFSFLAFFNCLWLSLMNVPERWTRTEERNRKIILAAAAEYQE